MGQKVNPVGFRLGVNRGLQNKRIYQKKCYQFWSIKSNDRENC